MKYNKIILSHRAHPREAAILLPDHTPLVADHRAHPRVLVVKQVAVVVIELHVKALVSGRRVEV